MKQWFRALGALTLVLSLNASADDGLWMPQQIPAVAAELKKLGLQLDPNQFADLTGFPMGAIVSLGGCSASFVSPDGLLATTITASPRPCSTTPRRRTTSSPTASWLASAARRSRPRPTRASTSRRKSKT